MIYKGQEAFISDCLWKGTKKWFIHRTSDFLYVSNDGEWKACTADDGWWATREEAEAFLISHSISQTPEYDEYDQSDD